VAVQHLCLDFVVDESLNLWLDSLKISCPPDAPLIDSVVAIAEEVCLSISLFCVLELGFERLGKEKIHINTLFCLLDVGAKIQTGAR